MDQRNLFSSRNARDAGIDQVLEHSASFVDTARWFVAAMMAGQRVTGEDIRFELVRHNVLPHHPNAWGGLVSALVKSGVLVDTGETRQMRARRSHARKTTLWQVVDNRGQS